MVNLSQVELLGSGVSAWILIRSVGAHVIRAKRQKTWLHQSFMHNDRVWAPCWQNCSDQVPGFGIKRPVPSLKSLKLKMRHFPNLRLFSVCSVISAFHVSSSLAVSFPREEQEYASVQSEIMYALFSLGPFPNCNMHDVLNLPWCSLQSSCSNRIWRSGPVCVCVCVCELFCFWTPQMCTVWVQPCAARLWKRAAGWSVEQPELVKRNQTFHFLFAC